MKHDNKESIEEISAMAAGAVEGAATSSQNDEDKEKEEKLRAIIRESIKLYAMKKEMLSNKDLQEQKIRQTIKKIMLSEKESKDPAPTSTLEGVMRSLLNNIVPQIRLDYMKLQTNEEERQGFKDYFYNAVAQTIDVAHDQMNPENTGEELEEQEKIVVKSDDPDFISGVSDGTEQEPSKEQAKDSESEKNISSYYERGQNFGHSAFQSIRDRIQNAVYSEIVPDEYEEFVKVLNANLQAWFKIWDGNKTEEDLMMPGDSGSDQPESQEEFDLGSEELEEDFEIHLE